MKLFAFAIFSTVCLFGQATSPLPTYNQATTPNSCKFGDLWFKPGVTAGQNLFGCTTAGTPGVFTLEGGTGGSTSPGGSSGQFQWNNSGSFGGFADLTVSGSHTVLGGASLIWNLSGAAHTIPAQVGAAASRPSACTVGEKYFANDATAGQNDYYCTSTNVWTQQLNSGSVASYATIQNAGTPVTQRGTLNFVSGITCVDNAGATRTDCTGTGGGATLGFMVTRISATVLGISPGIVSCGGLANAFGTAGVLTITGTMTQALLTYDCAVSPPALRIYTDTGNATLTGMLGTVLSTTTIPPTSFKFYTWTASSSAWESKLTRFPSKELTKKG